MTAELRIATNLALPLDAVTQTTAILGVRGSGKTSARKLILTDREGVRAAPELFG